MEKGQSQSFKRHYSSAFNTVERLKRARPLLRSTRIIYIPRFVNDWKLIVTLLVHYLQSLVDRQRGRDAQRGAEVHRGHFLVIPPENIF